MLTSSAPLPKINLPHRLESSTHSDQKGQDIQCVDLSSAEPLHDSCKKEFVLQAKQNQDGGGGRSSSMVVADSTARVMAARSAPVPLSAPPPQALPHPPRPQGAEVRFFFSKKLKDMGQFIQVMKAKLKSSEVTPPQVQAEIFKGISGFSSMRTNALTFISFLFFFALCQDLTILEMQMLEGLQFVNWIPD
jgi:hypothetical protein